MAKPDTFIDRAGQAVPFRIRATRLDEATEPGQWLTCEINPHGDAWQPMSRARTTGAAIRRAMEAWKEFDQRT